MAPAQDVAALANLPQPETMLTYASILEKPKYQIDEKTGARYLLATGEIVEAACAALRVCAALRATPQTPDAVREALAELIANRDGNTLGESRGVDIADHDKEKYRKFADRILKLIASHSPSASAGPQAEADHIGEYIADYSPLTAEEIAQEDPELTALYARSHPQPQQADGRDAVIEARPDAISAVLAEAYKMIGLELTVPQARRLANAALQQSDGPAK